MRIRKVFSRFMAMMVMGFLGQPAFSSENSSAPSRTLIIYFSQPEEMKPGAVDGFSGASVLQKNTPETGSTQFVAQLIQKQTHGDLYRIETATPTLASMMHCYGLPKRSSKLTPGHHLKRHSPTSAITTPFTLVIPSGGIPCQW